MSKALMAGIAVIVGILVLGGGYLLLNRNQTSNSSSSSEMQMTQSPTSSASVTNSPTTAGQTTSGNAVTIKNFQYGPGSITVKVGDSVTWTNIDSVAHSATADDNSFDTGLMQEGGSKTLKFDKAGTFKYHCSIHPNMHGTVVVQAQ